MEMKYKVVGNQVVEVNTNLMVFEADTLTKCQKLAKELNKGKGFNGWTPEFMLNKPR